MFLFYQFTGGYSADIFLYFSMKCQKKFYYNNDVITVSAATIIQADIHHVLSYCSHWRWHCILEIIFFQGNYSNL